MRILITGAAGFLGSHLCDRFLAEGHSVIAMDNLITGNTRNIAHLAGNPKFLFIKHDVTNHIYVAGQIPFLNGEKMHQGKIGADLTTDQGIEAAKACALNILAQVNAAVNGDWNRVERCVKLGGFVNCTPDFTDHPKVINAASEVLIEVFGDAGRHARFALGAGSLPLNVSCEIAAVLEVSD